MPFLMKRLKYAQVRHRGRDGREIVTGLMAIARPKGAFSQENISIKKIYQGTLNVRFGC